eukprot:m.240670 g.240670  ORF g.240670 m.240670 type:complete len:233 (+) comp13709_c0_seq1:92-790(+)
MAEEEFGTWLLARLAEFSMDEPTVQYVKDLVCLDADESDAEKMESIGDFLAEATGGDASALSAEILEKWAGFRAKKEANQAPVVRLEDIAKEILDRPVTPPAVQEEKKTPGNIDARLKAALLSQYDIASGEETDSDEDSEEDADGQRRTKTPSERKVRQQRKNASAADVAAMFENTNSKRVLDAQKQQRDAQRNENTVRVARDRAALAADRESKAKKKEDRRKATQKQERRS